MELKIQSFVLGPVMTNAYLIWDEGTKHGIVIDPGSHPTELATAIQEKQLSIEAILLTHAHFDHIGGVEDVRKMSDADVYIHEQEADWLTDPEKNGSALFGAGRIQAKEADVLLSGGETFTFLGEEVRIIHTPGHSPGSVSYYWENHQFVVSGDVLFQGSIGRTDLPGGNHETLMKSISQLIELPEETSVLPGHGESTTLADEQHTNPFLHGLD